MPNFRITIASLPDREQLVAEVLVDDIQLAEVNQEEGRLTLEIYPRPDGEPWRLDFDSVCEAFGRAKARLVQI